MKKKIFLNFIEFILIWINKIIFNNMYKDGNDHYENCYYFHCNPKTPDYLNIDDLNCIYIAYLNVTLFC